MPKQEAKREKTESSQLAIDKKFEGDEIFMDAINEINLLAEEFSFGIESKPTIVFAPALIPTEDEEPIQTTPMFSYIIIKNSKVIHEGIQ